jgi:hypothetical protein
MPFMLFALRSAALNRLGAAADLASAAIADEVAQSIVQAGYVEALNVMSGMPGNEGQITVYREYVVPAFEKQFAISYPNAGDEFWDDVNIGEYMDFMGEIVGEGNMILEEAFYTAYEVKEGASAAGGGGGLTEFGAEGLEGLEELGEEFED